MTNVLIVEDHVSMRESLTTALTAAGDFSVVGETMLWISVSICIRNWC